jgi:hypothetical protein
MSKKIITMQDNTVYLDGQFIPRDQLAGETIYPVYGRGDHATVFTSYSRAERDTRGQCYSMWEETWTGEAISA